MALLENMAEEDTWSLGERGSFYDQLGARLLDQDDGVVVEVGRSYLNGPTCGSQRRLCKKTQHVEL
jgi:hypothetical protein